MIGAAGGRRQDGDTEVLTPGERVALYEVLIAARDLRGSCSVLPRGGLGVVVQSANLVVLEASDPPPRTSPSTRIT